MKKFLISLATLIMAVGSFPIACNAAATPSPTPKPAVTAQAKAPSTPGAGPKDEALTKTEQIASRTVFQDIQAVQSEMQSFQEEITKNHPGYHYNFQTGKLDADPKPEPKLAPKADKP